jgi:uncharacterized membrane protein
LIFSTSSLVALWRRITGKSLSSKNGLGSGGYILRGMEKIRIEQHSIMGGVWFGAWLFTIGFLHLGFWKGVLAIVIWPYYLGVHFSAMMR